MPDINDVRDTYTVETKLVDSASGPAAQLAGKLDAMEQSARDAAAAVLSAGDAAGKAGQQVTAASASWDRLAARNDAVTAAAQKLAAAQEQLARAQRLASDALAAGTTDQETVARVTGTLSTNVQTATANLQKAREAADASKASNGALTGTLNTLVTTTNAHAASAGNAAFAQRQLGVQTVQFFSSIQAGQPVLTAFIQQGHQLVDVALATGTVHAAIARRYFRETRVIEWSV